jgi:heat shock protein HslJ
MHLLSRWHPWLLGVALLCSSCALAVDPAPVEERSALTVDPARMTYRSTLHESGAVTLEQGVFRQPAAPGAAAEFTVRLSDRQLFGTVAGRDVGAVILVTEAGGSGSFHELALLVSDGDHWVNSDTRLLGDRIVVHDLSIRDGEVLVELTGHGPQDPLCCPTQRARQRFAVQDGKLVAVGESLVAPAILPLVGPRWQWLRTLYGDDSLAAPENPEKYAVTFDLNGIVSVRADCNQKGGSYKVEGQSLAIELNRSTMAMCPEDSLEGNFVRDLTGVAIWFMKDGDLYLDLRYDTGTMQLRRQERESK